MDEINPSSQIEPMESSAGLLSILMPTHNRADILPIVLESFEKIELPSSWRVEMIIVVNACSDNTAEVLDEALPQLPFAARYVIDPIAGSSHARNLAVEESAGDILVFVDDDVLVSTGWLTGFLEVFDTTPADFVGGPVHLWWHDVQRPDWFPESFDSLLAAKDHGSEVIELFQSSAVITINTAYRREIFDEIGLFRLDLERRGKGTGSYEDVEFNQRALDSEKRLFYAPNSPVQHWVEPSRMSYSAMSKMIYYVGQARAFAKPQLDFRTLFRSFAGNLWLVARHIPGELVARGFQSGESAFAHRKLWTLGCGGLVGMSKRLMGKSSGY